MIKGIIYKIYNLKDSSQFYIGSTINYSRRKSHHKKNVTNKRGKRYWTRLYVYIRNNGGWINFCMEELVNQEFNSLKDLHIFEQNYIINYKPTLNSISAYCHPPKTEPINHPDEQFNPTTEPILFIIDLDN